MKRGKLRTGFLGVASAVVLASGCGGATHDRVALAAACAHTRTTTEAIFRTHVARLLRHGLTEPSAASAALGRGVAASAAKTLSVDRAAAAEIRQLPSTAAARSALAMLTANEAGLATLRADGGEQPIRRVFRLAEASGGCRRARAAIGG